MLTLFLEQDKEPDFTILFHYGYERLIKNASKAKFCLNSKNNYICILNDRQSLKSKPLELKNRLFMSLPVFNAISFQRIFEKGGHSRPWVVLVNANEIPKPFVVKLYRTLDIEARNKMTAEVLGNVLANQFGLNRPMAAIINFSDEFRMTLNKECEDILCQTDERVKFGTELIEPAFLYNPGISRYQTSKYILPDSLYAFDYFICNRDRNLEKPNLILNNDKAFLIDHEMGLGDEQTNYI